MSGDLAGWLEQALGYTPTDMTLFERALTHGSAARESYERLEFLGDRVLGLTIARWLYERFPAEPEGQMSRRYNVLVARETCAEIGRDIGIPKQIRLGKQAREDGAIGSDNVVGDVVEALLGALLLDGGLAAADAFIRRQWAPFLDSQKRAPQHPKSRLQEFAAAKGHRPPTYELVGRSGPHHAPTFTVKVMVNGLGEAEAGGASKQEAETAAAAALMEKYS
nr:ribonuclease III ['Sphingomonas ginsengisoli' Hoang et al. 2012]